MIIYFKSSKNFKILPESYYALTSVIAFSSEKGTKTRGQFCAHLRAGYNELRNGLGMHPHVLIRI